MSLDVTLLPLLKDNYAYLLRDTQSGAVAVVDPSESPPVVEALEARGWTLDVCLNTHHHWDHTGGNVGLKERFACAVVGPEYDRARLASLDRGLKDGDDFQLGAQAATILYVPGHTLGHIVFWFREAQAAFCGDTLFSLGCGRMFEGSPEQMWSSLARLRALPPETRLYCGHEYTADNARFALSVDPTNAALTARAEAVGRLRAAGDATLPTTVASERACNPFFRVDAPQIRASLGMPEATDTEVFAELRRRKDHF